MRAGLVIGFMVLAGCASPASVEEAPALSVAAGPARPDAATAGRMMAQQKCSVCHAVERGGESPVQSAPTFASISGKYADSSLAAVLTEGIATGHPSMPRWMFSPGEARELLAYIRSLRSEEGA